MFFVGLIYAILTPPCQQQKVEQVDFDFNIVCASPGKVIEDQRP